MKILKAVLLGASTLAILVAAQMAKADQYGYTVCRTSSNGFNFSDGDADYLRAQDRVTGDCTADARTSDGECRANVHCDDNGNGGNGGGYSGGNDGGYGAYIDASPNPCHAGSRDLCTAYLRWSTGSWGGGAVVTVTSRNEGREKVYACNDNDNGEAPWIAPGDSYTFKLYRSNNCDSSVGYYNQPVAQVIVQGLR